MGNKISVVIQTYNAERYLQQALDSVKEFDEVVICDMESTDNTLEIAKRNGCKIVNFPKLNYTICEAYRDASIHSASNDWVLVLDADELVTKELKDYLYSLINKDDICDAYLISRRNYFMGQFMRCLYPDQILRFMRKSKTQWPSTIHSKPKIDGTIGKLPRNRKELAFIHLCNESISDRLQKTDRYTSMEVERRKSKGYGTIAFLLRPTAKFIKFYILKAGFLDGKAGFIRSLLEAYYQTILLSKIEEEKLHPDTYQKETR